MKRHDNKQPTPSTKRPASREAPKPSRLVLELPVEEIRGGARRPCMCDVGPCGSS